MFKILNKGDQLYRSDLTQPPAGWTTNFHTYQFGHTGNKNKAGLFFFTDSVAIAEDIARCSNKQ